MEAEADGVIRRTRVLLIVRVRAAAEVQVQLAAVQVAAPVAVRATQEANPSAQAAEKATDRAQVLATAAAKATARPRVTAQAAGKIQAPVLARIPLPLEGAAKKRAVPAGLDSIQRRLAPGRNRRVRSNSSSTGNLRVKETIHLLLPPLPPEVGRSALLQQQDPGRIGRNIICPMT